MLKQARFLFHTDLIDLLSPHRREAEIDIPPNGDQSVKHLIESLGVPHTEVGKVLVNGLQVDFSYLVKEGIRLKCTRPPLWVVQTLSRAHIALSWIITWDG